MRLHSTNSDPSTTVSLREAVLRSLPDDGGLYVPVSIPSLPSKEIDSLKGLSIAEVSVRVAGWLIGNSIPSKELEQVVERAIDFKAPVRPVTDQISVLELFHGPSLAFKDFGARFMAELVGLYTRSSDKPVTILVATSGDTGGAVAAGFHNVSGVEVIILYPSGRVSTLQEKQLTTLGGNVSAYEVQGSFDDCQAMVKRAFLDPDLTKRLQLSSANSINIARLIPQTFYYFNAFAQTGQEDLVFSIPSGNLGNLTAGVIAKQMGLRVKHFLAATNRNDVIPQYLSTGRFAPAESIQTISNAMDVGNPSNFARILHFYGSTWNKITTDLLGYSFSDDQTREAMARIYDLHGYMCDPHGAVAYLAADAYLSANSTDHVVFLETAHPAKFLDVVESVVGSTVPIPARLEVLQHRKKEAVLLSPNYTNFKDLLLSRG